MNGELKELYEEDVKEREGIGSFQAEGEELLKHDRARRRKTYAIIENGGLKVSEDFYHAALIFQHGETSDDYNKANELAQKAMEMGDDRAKWLYAATLDRWLLSIGRAQKFGTQFERNESGDWELAQPIDDSVTDEERARYNVPPFSEALKVYKEKYNRLGKVKQKKAIRKNF